MKMETLLVYIKSYQPLTGEIMHIITKLKPTYHKNQQQNKQTKPLLQIQSFSIIQQKMYAFSYAKYIHYKRNVENTLRGNII